MYIYNIYIYIYLYMYKLCSVCPQQSSIECLNTPYTSSCQYRNYYIYIYNQYSCSCTLPIWYTAYIHLYTDCILRISPPPAPHPSTPRQKECYYPPTQPTTPPPQATKGRGGRLNYQNHTSTGGSVWGKLRTYHVYIYI